MVDGASVSELSTLVADPSPEHGSGAMVSDSGAYSGAATMESGVSGKGATAASGARGNESRHGTREEVRRRREARGCVVRGWRWWRG